jgi:hypothetical protein
MLSWTVVGYTQCLITERMSKQCSIVVGHTTGVEIIKITKKIMFQENNIRSYITILLKL